MTHYSYWQSLRHFYHQVRRNTGLVPAQDVNFFYTRSHFSALQSFALILSKDFQFIFTLKKSALHNLVIELCRALKIILFFHGYLVNLRTVL